MRGEGTPRIGTAVAGPDPKTNRFAEYCFESTGSHFVNRYEIKDGPSALGVGRGKRTGIINGKEYERDIIVDRKTNDHFVYMVTSDKGEDVKLVFRRASAWEKRKGCQMMAASRV